MSLALGGHTCTYYCQPPVHALQILARPDVTAEALHAAIQAYWSFGGTVEGVRPAHEADVPTWAQGMKEGLTEDYRVIYRELHSPECSVPWLVFLRLPEEEDTP